MTLIVRAALPRSTQIRNHSIARSCRRRTGHFSSKITDTLNRTVNCGRTQGTAPH